MVFLTNLNKREKSIFLATILFIAFSLLYNGVFVPYFRRAAILDKEITLLENKLMKAKRLIPRKSEIEKGFQALALQNKEEGVSSEKQIARLLIEIENLSKKANVYINDIKPRPVKGADYYNEIVVEIRLEAPIKEIAQFMYDIQQSKELLKVEKFDINIKSDDSTTLEGFLEIHKISL